MIVPIVNDFAARFSRLAAQGSRKRSLIPLRVWDCERARVASRKPRTTSREASRKPRELAVGSVLSRIPIMKHLRHLALGTTACVCLLGVSSLAADWPHWRGPNASGVSPDRTLPIRWSATESIAWKAPIAGAGVSTPIVSGDRVYVTSQIGAGIRREGNHPRLVQGADAAAQGERALGVDVAAGADPSKTFFVVEAFGRADGKRLWERRIEATGTLTPVHDKHNLATPSPVTDGTLVFGWFGTGQVVALDRTGAVVWQRHLATENGAVRHSVGTRQLAGASRRSADPALRSARALLPAGHRQEDGEGPLESGPRPGTLVLQYAARGRRRLRHRSHRQLDRADRFLRCEDRSVPLAYGRDEPLCRAVTGLPRRRGLRLPRLPQWTLHGNQTRRARRRHRRRRRSGASRRAHRIARRFCITTASSTWRTTSAC